MSTQNQDKHKFYLPHIDGIRAIAFLNVLFFHFKFSFFRNGFLGVDIFLVISGFLMTRIITKDVRSNSFSMITFIKKRFWRLYPTFITTVALTLIAGCFVFSTGLMKDLVKSTYAAIFFSSNIYYSKDYLYFGLRSQFRPLLHTWSLSLEEQFYIVWPGLLILLNFCCKKVFVRPWQYDASIFILALVSIAMSCAFESKHSNFVFYWLPCRFFEFLIGAIASLYHEVLNGKQFSKFLSNTLSVIGLIILHYSVFGFVWKQKTMQNLLTCIGTAFLILSPNAFFSMYLLSSKPLVFVGKLSYAAYLVHWPVWVIYGTLNGFRISREEKLWLALATIISAVLLRMLVEQPFRQKRSRTRDVHMICILVLILATSSLPSSISEKDGMEKLEQWKSKAYSRLYCKKLPREHTIFAAFRATEPLPQSCVIGNSNITSDSTSFTAILIGSSFADHLIPGLRLLSVEKNATFLVLASKNCAYQPSGSSSDFVDFPYTAVWCIEENRRRNQLLNSLKPQRILLADFILLRFAGFGFNVLKGKDVLEHPTKGAFVYFKSSCQNLVAKKHIVSFLGDTPFLNYEAFEGVISNVKLQSITSVRRRESLDEMLNWHFSPHDQQFEVNKRLIKFFREENNLKQCKMFDMMHEFCRAYDGKTKCDFFDATTGIPIYTDGAHLSEIGSWKARNVISNEVLKL